MANAFSDNLTPADTPLGPYSANYRRDGAITGARVRKKRMVVATGAILVVADTLVLGTFRSGDRISDLRLSFDPLSTGTAAIDLGLYKAALDHIPVAANLIDVDLFCSAKLITTVLDRFDCFTEAGTLEDWQRGLTLWELANHTGASYTTDPMEDWDLVATVRTANTSAPQTFLFEADYVSFG